MMGRQRPSAVKSSSHRTGLAKLAYRTCFFGNGMIMFGSVNVSEFDRLTKQPDEIGDAETQTAYVIVSGR